MGVRGDRIFTNQRLYVVLSEYTGDVEGLRFNEKEIGNGHCEVLGRGDRPDLGV